MLVIVDFSFTWPLNEVSKDLNYISILKFDLKSIHIIKTLKCINVLKVLMICNDV